MLIASLDANVLVPIVLCDFLLTALDHAIYEPIVSSVALDEVERALLVDFPRLDPSAVHRRVDAMRRVLQDHIVDGDERAAPSTVNDKDRHIVAAAIEGGAGLVVTNDRRLRAEIEAARIDLPALDVDRFVQRLWAASPDRVGRVVDALVDKRRRPVTRAEVLAALRPHVPAMVAASAPVPSG